MRTAIKLVTLHEEYNILKSYGATNLTSILLLNFQVAA